MCDPVTVYRPFLYARVAVGVWVLIFGIWQIGFALSQLQVNRAGVVVFEAIGLLFTFGAVRTAMARVAIGAEELGLHGVFERGVCPDRRSRTSPPPSSTDPS